MWRHPLGFVVALCVVWSASSFGLPGQRVRPAALRTRHALRMAEVEVSSVCIVGSSDILTQLVVGKIAAKEGIDASVLTQDDKKAYEANSLMYGRKVARAIRDKAGEGLDSSVKRCVPRVAGDLSDRLVDTDAVVVVATEKAFDPKVFGNAIIADASKCTKVVLVSKHGASSDEGGGGGGFLGGLLGGDGERSAMGVSEKAIGAICEERGISFSIVRVGSLKGGGPGLVEDGAALYDWGLDKHW